MDTNGIANLTQAVITAATFGWTVWVWLRQRKTKASSEQAAKSADAAATAARTAAVSANRAAENTTATVKSISDVATTSELTSGQVDGLQKAILIMAEHLEQQYEVLVEQRRTIDRMAARNDDTVAALLRSEAKQAATGPVVQQLTGQSDTVATIAGRHRYATQSIPTLDKGDPA